MKKISWEQIEELTREYDEIEWLNDDEEEVKGFSFEKSCQD